jgi:hypothetical protein
MVEKLPKNLSTLTREKLQQAVRTRDERLTPLFRRWPKLNRLEMEELRRLYQERVRVAKHLGRKRSLRRRAGRESG